MANMDTVALVTERKLTQVDDILPLIGGYGKFQFIVQIIIAFAAVPEVLQGLIMYFAANTPSWICINNGTYCELGKEYLGDNKMRCQIPADAWRYSRDYTYSVVTQFHLDCDEAWQTQLPTSLFYLGTAAGSIVIGFLGDNYGRKTVMIPSVFFLVTSGLISAFSPSFFFLGAIRFICGFFVPGCAINMSIILSEQVLPHLRTWSCCGLFILWPIGLSFLSLMAYYIPNWKILVIVSTVPFYLAVAACFFIPESLRWLLIHDKEDSAMDILKRISIWNKKQLPGNIALDTTRRVGYSSPRDLFSTKGMFTLTMICGLKWFTVSLVYYGIPMTSDDLTNGSMYVNFVLTCGIEIPALVFNGYASERFGRKAITIGSLLAAGLACLPIPFIPNDGGWHMLRLFFGVFGRLSMCVTYAAIYTWTIELYPTHLRSQGIGFGSITAKLGCTAMPWVVKTTKHLHYAVPFATMGILSIVTCLLLSKLPETKGKDLSNNIVEEKPLTFKSVDEEELIS